MVEKSLQTEAASQPSEEGKEGYPQAHCRAQTQGMVVTLLVSASTEVRVCDGASAFAAVRSAQAYYMMSYNCLLAASVYLGVEEDTLYS